jgi:proteic killer suppression protein
VLVTGAGGFIGSLLTDIYLLSEVTESYLHYRAVLRRDSRWHDSRCHESPAAAGRSCDPREARLRAGSTEQRQLLRIRIVVGGDRRARDTGDRPRVGDDTDHGQLVESRLFRKIQMIDDATTDQDLRVPPSNHFEKLRGNLEGLHSIRVNKQWRLIFQWDSGRGEAIGLYLDDHSYL